VDVDEPRTVTVTDHSCIPFSNLVV